ncbi:hypothetical protein [Aestuariivirga sp.]|uniref:hypothetical protein n=1 Tax=Aestuariivirga sp. TaxID=2650926 RepID=UPI0035931555
MAKVKRKQLFDDPHLSAEYFPAQGQTLVITFSSFSGNREIPSRFGFPFLITKGIPAIYIVAKQNHWWQVEGLVGMCATIRRYSKQFDRVVAYGSSMGGYGALLTADAVGATHVLAVSPQTVIGNPDFPLKENWAAFIAQRPILRDDVRNRLGGAREVMVLYDPALQRDLLHFEHIAGLPAVRGFPTPFASHKILRSLQEMGILSQVIVSLLRGEVDHREYRALVRAGRHRSPSYLKHLALNCDRRNHPRWSEAVRQKLAALSPDPAPEGQTELANT